MFLRCRTSARLCALVALFWLIAGACYPDTPDTDVFKTPVTADNIDTAVFAQYVDGAVQPITANKPTDALWTQSTSPAWNGLQFSDSKTSGFRAIRFGFKSAIPVGTILVKGTVGVSVLSPTATYPGRMDVESDWIPARRILRGDVSVEQAGPEDYVLWVLPTGTSTRALRFVHTAQLTDNQYNGAVGGVWVLTGRFANLAIQATALASANNDNASRINVESIGNVWDVWDNASRDAAKALPLISKDNPVNMTLSWAKPVAIRGLCSFWTGFGSADIQIYTGDPTKDVREATDSDWRTVKSVTGVLSGYPLFLGPNWFDFGATLETKAVRLHMTQVTVENHPHLNGNTASGRRVWLREVMALSPLGASLLSTALPAPAPSLQAVHPPIAIRFTLKEPGYVTLVIDNAQGQRVRNLISETYFPAGNNVAWWDAQDDVGRDTDAASHGLYHVPGKDVEPGVYRVRGIVHPQIGLRYEFSLYSAGNPSWPTADGSGAWLANHTPPEAVLFVPAARDDKPAILVGSYVTEGRSGLAWLDTAGRKTFGEVWVGGAWTGAPYLARDDGKLAVESNYAYAASAFDSSYIALGATDQSGKAPQGEVRVTALTKQGDKAVLKYQFGAVGGDITWSDYIGGMAVRNGVLVVAMTKLDRLLFVDVDAGQVIGTASIPSPQGLAFDADGNLLILSTTCLLRAKLPADLTSSTIGIARTITLSPTTLVSSGLEVPIGIALDSSGNIYISDRGTSHQVKVFTPAGGFVRAIGHKGEPQAGPYDPEHMNNPAGLTIDDQARLWVTEDDFQPKRVSVWSMDGKLLQSYYGPAQYGGGGTLDPLDKTRYYYDGMEFKLDWATGENHPADIYWRPRPDQLTTPDGYGAGAPPETPLYVGGRQYMTNCYNSNATNGASIAMLFRMTNGIAVPIAAAGSANDWSVLKDAAYKDKWPSGIDLNGKYWDNRTFFIWSDTNGDGKIEPSEVAFLKGNSGGVTVAPDLSFVCRIDDKILRFPAASFSTDGVPAYAGLTSTTVATGAQSPVSTGGDQELLGANGWAVLTTAAKPYSPFGLCGLKNGMPVWSYPSMWPGLHASHSAAMPSFPGELIGTTRLLGGMVESAGDAGPLFVLNGNMGDVYLFTEDGLFVSQLFQDSRQGKAWSMPVAMRNMKLNELTLNDENFFPSITQTAGGQTYMVDGTRSSIVRIDGLDHIKRLPDRSIHLTASDLTAAHTYTLAAESARQKAKGTGIILVAIRQDAPAFDGDTSKWSDADWATIDKSGAYAYFNSNSAPYNYTASICIGGDKLYAAFRTGDRNLLTNSAENPKAMFKFGGALDLMIGAPSGPERLLVTRTNGKLLAMLYRPHVDGAKDPVAFSSPWRTVMFDRVDDVTPQVQLVDNNAGDYELSIPLATIGLTPAAGDSIRGDIGILRGDGFQTMQRVYWSNKATGITADVPSEAELTPDLWGKWIFTKR